MNDLKLKANLYLNSEFYFITLGSLAFINWVFELDFLFMAFVLVFLIIISLTSKNTLHIIPIIFFSQISTPLFRNDVTIIGGTIILSLIYVIIDWILNRKFKTFGIFSLPFLFFIVATIFSVINIEDINYWYISIVQVLIIWIAYFYFRNTLEKDKLNFIFISKVFTYLSLFIALQFFYKFITYDGPIMDLFLTRTKWDLGWDNINICIYPALISIPLTSYLLIKSKYKLMYLIFLSIQIFSIALTLSRSSLLSVFIYIVVLIPIILYFEKSKIKLVIHSLLFIILLAIGVYFLEQYNVVTDVFKALFDREWGSFETRTYLIDIALIEFNKHPIIGTGGLYTSAYYLRNHIPYFYHNTIIQTLTLGIVGITCLIYMFYIKFRLLLINRNSFKVLVLVMIIVTALINGMFQPTYYYYSYMIYIFIILSIVEIESCN